jgi:hypothetical protein
VGSLPDTAPEAGSAKPLRENATNRRGLRHRNALARTQDVDEASRDGVVKGDQNEGVRWNCRPLRERTFHTIERWPWTMTDTDVPQWWRRINHAARWHLHGGFPAFPCSTAGAWASAGIVGGEDDVVAGASGTTGATGNGCRMRAAPLKLLPKSG